VTAALTLDAVSAAYGATPVLEALSLTVPAGSLTALLGPSGCGKTTALKVVAGLVAPTSGDVWLGETRLTGVPAERRGIGVVFQKPLLFPHLTVAGNVAFGLAVRGVPAARIRAAVHSALHLVQLDGFESRRPRELSGGQEQRVSIARALVTEPRVLLLDEPLTALDEHLRAEMRALLVGLQRTLGITTLLVTHDQHEAALLASQVALVLDGRIAQSGPPRAFYTNPASADVARFFGWCVIPCDLESTRLAVPGGHLPLPAGAMSGARWAAFHPSSVTIGPADSGADGCGIDGVVTYVVDRGYERRVGARLAGGHVLELTSTGPLACTPAVASILRIGVPSSAIRLFH